MLNGDKIELNANDEKESQKPFGLRFMLNKGEKR